MLRVDGVVRERRAENINPENRPTYLSVRQVEGGIRLGTLPPSAWEVQGSSELTPDERYSHDEPVIYSEASKIPYCLVVVAEGCHEG